MLPSNESLATAQLAIYIPVLIVCTIVVLRHGFHRQLGWVFLVILAIVRIIGSGLEIAAVKNPHNSINVEWAAILQSVGISPLLLASLGLLKRIIDETSTRVPSESGFQIPLVSLSVIAQLSKRLTKNAPAASHRSRVIHLLYLPCTVAFILCIIGGTDLTSTNQADQRSGKSLLKAGITLFVVIYAALFLLTILTARDFDRMVKEEQRILMVVLAALPFLAVRILFGMFSIFVDDKTFAIFGGSVLARVLMATVEEFLVVIAYTVVGLITPKIVERQVDGQT